MLAVGEELGLTEGPSKTKIFGKDAISSLKTHRQVKDVQSLLFHTTLPGQMH